MKPIIIGLTLWPGLRRSPEAIVEDDDNPFVLTELESQALTQLVSRIQERIASQLHQEKRHGL